MYALYEYIQRSSETLNNVYIVIYRFDIPPD